jgi:GT2 family glycosyltransferase/glycosyltransferase involved in cell wall biosynthesis
VRGALRPNTDVVVCVPVFEAYDDVVQCLAALVSHTAADVPLLVIDDGSTEPRLHTLSFDTSHDVIIWHQPVNGGFVATVNAGLRATGRSDVVVVNSDVIVGPGWLERLKATAYTSSTVATVTPLTNHGTVLSVGGGRNSPSRRLPDGFMPAQAAERVAQVSRLLRPVIPTAVGHCIYFRRSALEVVGLLDEAFSPGYSEEVDFSQRAIARGLVHLCADDVFVFHKGGSSFGRSEAVTKLILDHDDLIGKRYPYYFSWIRATAQDPYSPLAAALLVANAAIAGLRVIVDGWCVGPTMMGTQIVVLETVCALARHPQVSEVTVVVPQSISASSKATLEQSGAKVVVGHGPEHSLHMALPGDLVYRPYQVTRMADLEWLLAAAPRFVVCQMDCIAYNNPAYFADLGQWATYRRVNQLTSQVADGLTFLSESVLTQARSSGLLPDATVTATVYSGTDRLLSPSAPRTPIGISESLSGFFLCLGASYKHKNRVLALRIWAAAREQGWTGDLVLAGPTPPDGNSLMDEDAFLLEHPDLSRGVWRLGALSEAEKNWLYARAALVLYPTISEGFGLVPFEAAAHNVPCLSTRAGSLDEILPTDVPTIDLGDVSSTARLAMEMAEEGPLRIAVCRSLNLRGADFTWAATADRLVEFFWEVIGRPSREPSRTTPLLETPGLRVGREVAARNFGVLHRPLAWSVRQVAERPQLRQLVIPPGSRRLKLGGRFVGYLDRRAR